MEETIELRIPEDKAGQLLRPTDGVCLNGTVRKLTLRLGDPLATKIASHQRELIARGDYFFLGWVLSRQYSPKEIRSADALKVLIKRVFEPSGEECGTRYDEAVACRYCGAGARRIGGLILDSKSIPSDTQTAIAKTIAGEIVVSTRLVELFENNGLLGATFRPILSRGSSNVPLHGWFELVVNSPRLAVTQNTRAGDGPFDEILGVRTVVEKYQIDDRNWGIWCDVHRQYRCPLGDTLGLNLLSEVSVDGSSFRGYDIAMTKQYFGVRRGVLRPEPVLVISPRFYRLISGQDLRGTTFEVCHLVSESR